VNRTTATAGLAALLLAGGGVALASNGADDPIPTSTSVTSTDGSDDGSGHSGHGGHDD
jgi:hypothetical protein